MAAPGITARVLPSGIRLKDGYQTVIAFAADADISFWEMGVKPPGIDGGDAIDTTTMHNAVWRSRAPRALRTLTESDVKAAYDPKLYNNILALVNVETAITVHFPDGATLAFWGYLKSFEPAENTEGKMPEATIKIIPTNTDPSDGSEAAPVMTPVTGT